MTAQRPDTFEDAKAAAREDALAAALARHEIVCEAARLKDMAEAMKHLDRMVRRLYEMRGMSDDIPEPMRRSLASDDDTRP